MVDKMNKKLKEEIAIQDKVSTMTEKIKYSKSYSRIYHEYWFNTMKSVINNEGLILDYGCGTGESANYFSPNKVVGIDISVKMLKYAKKRLKYIVNTDVSRLPFKDEVFDVVFCRGVLHHLLSLDTPLTEIERVLKKRGEFVLCEPIDNIFNNFMKNRIKRKDLFSSFHHGYSLKNLISDINKRFDIVEIKNFGYIAYPLLAFPNITKIFDYFPFKTFFTYYFINMDKIISKIHFLKNQSWAVIIKAKKII